MEYLNLTMGGVFIHMLERARPTDPYGDINKLMGFTSVRYWEFSGYQAYIWCQIINDDIKITPYDGIDEYGTYEFESLYDDITNDHVFDDSFCLKNGIGIAQDFLLHVSIQNDIDYYNEQTQHTTVTLLHIRPVKHQVLPLWIAASEWQGSSSTGLRIS